MQMERRLSHQLVQYWQEIKGDKILPSEADIDSDELEGMWEDCFHIYLREGVGMEDNTFASYGHVGLHLQPVFIDEPGQTPHLATLTHERLCMAYREMQMTKLPIVENVEEFPLDGRFIKYRQCLLPIGTAKGEIQGIFGGMRFRYA